MNVSAAERFVRQLEKLGAAGQAALKAEAGRPPRPDVPAFDAFTAAFWPLRDTGLMRDACRLVAALYFWHPMKGGRGSFGGTLRRAAGRGRVATATERVLEQLLAAPFSGLHGSLFEAVRLLTTVRVPVDWPQLIVDLGRWNRPTKDEELSVQEAWANSWLNYGSEHAD
jgi:CRISPR type I-E-associated protein CasB/Cse2